MRTLDSLRSLIRDNPRTPDGYPPDVREAAGAYARFRRTAGDTWATVERDLGISCTSLRAWMQASPPGRFQQVVVVEDSPGQTRELPALTLTNPAGFTLSGCSLEQAAWLMSTLQ